MERDECLADLIGQVMGTTPQREVADRCGISQTSVFRLSQGKPLAPKTLVKFLDGMKVTGRERNEILQRVGRLQGAPLHQSPSDESALRRIARETARLTAEAMREATRDEIARALSTFRGDRPEVGEPVPGSAIYRAALGALSREFGRPIPVDHEAEEAMTPDEAFRQYVSLRDQLQRGLI